MYATNIGLDVKTFAADLEGRKYLPRMKENFSSGARSGVNGTPTFFINGARFDGAWDEAGLIAALSER